MEIHEHVPWPKSQLNWPQRYRLTEDDLRAVEQDSQVTVSLIEKVFFSDEILNESKTL